MNTRVLLVTGSSPPDGCGVGDYTVELASALEKAGYPAELYCHRSWSAVGTSAAIRRMLRAGDSLVHIQYPTMGYGYSIGPQFCTLAKPSIVTLHEFSLSHKLRKLSLLPFTLRTSSLVMTSEFERNALLRRMPWAEKRLRVIPIGSNMPQPRCIFDEREESVVYFGLIMPRKGLEDFIEFSKYLRERGIDWELRIIGRIAPAQEQYARNLMEISRPYRIQWSFDRNPEEVSELLSRASLGYLAFPDGASERRGSLKAACMAGLACITTRSEQTSKQLEEAVVMAGTPREAAELAVRLMAAKDERMALSRRAYHYSQEFAWNRIADLHIQMYEEVSGQACKARA